jgi:hypothetical protein
MSLMTRDLMMKIPFHESRRGPDPTVYAKFFCPYSAAAWWVLAYDKDDTLLCFAYLGDEDMAEMGDVSLSELDNLVHTLGPHGVVERDIAFDQKKLSEALKEHGLAKAAARFAR